MRSLFVLLLSVSLLGCLTKVEPSAGSAGKTCTANKNCRRGFTCLNGTCQDPNASDAGTKDAIGGKSDGSLAPSDGSSTASDGKADLVKPDTSVAPDAHTAPDTRAPDALAADQDVPALQPDGLASQLDGPVVQPDVAGSPDTLPCNGGCCGNADCPLDDKPVCSDNKCVGCKVSDDCKGRSLTVCKTSTGACVQCTDKPHCGGTLTCNTETNQCVGCTSRSDCQGACQKCSSGSCVPVKDGDDSDPSKCAGTCNSQGACKAKQGQKCSQASDCLSGAPCADGVCCNRACSGVCEACDLSTPPGTCTVLTAGSQPRHGPCANTGTGVANTTCAGSCQGKNDGTCSYAPDTTSCGTAMCTSGQAQAAGKCNGTGLCTLPPAVTCKTGSSCTGAGACECLASLPNECPTACVNFNTDSKNCGACGRDCLGGTCLEGVCQPVVVASPATSYRMTVFGLDAQYVYYATSLTPFSNNHERISISSGTVTTLRTDSQARGIGVIGGTAYFGPVPNGKPMYCTASSCTATLNNLDDGLADFGHPSPPYYAISREEPNTLFLEITWHTTGNTSIANWRDNVSRDNDSEFTSFGNSVFWLRQTSTTRELLSVDSTTPSSITRKRMAGQLPAGCVIHGINPQSLLLLCTSGLRRVPLPNGMNNDTPTLVLSPASNVQHAIEDANYLYWADTIGSIYKCPSNDLPNCVGKQSLLTTSAPTTGFFQDSKYLYWGTVAESEPAKAQLLRLAK